MGNFEFSKGNIIKLKTLNAKLRNEEWRARTFFKQIKSQLDVSVLSKKIDDYLFQERLVVFSNNIICCQRHKVEIGKQIYDGNSYLYRFFEEEAEFEKNWNDLKDINHPMSSEYFCYLMNYLVFETPLTWWDISCIDDIWIEYKIDCQFIMDKDLVTNLGVD